MDENAPATEPRTEGQDADAAPAQDADAPKRTAAEYAETFNKAVDVAEQVLRFAPLPAGAKRVATRAMPTMKKVAKVAPMVAPAAEPYVRKAAAKAKEVAPEVAQAAKTGGEDRRRRGPDRRAGGGVGREDGRRARARDGPQAGACGVRRGQGRRDPRP